MQDVWDVRIFRRRGRGGALVNRYEQTWRSMQPKVSVWGGVVVFGLLGIAFFLAMFL